MNIFIILIPLFILGCNLVVQTNSHRAFGNIKFSQGEKNYMLHKFMQHKRIKCLK